VTSIVAVGAGRMGRGIAQVFAYAGNAVTLIDLKDRKPAGHARLFDDALLEIRGNLAFLADEGVFDAGLIDGIMARITTAGPDRAAQSLAAAHVVFEGVPEVLEVKRRALQLVSARAPATAIIASTTSTIQVDQLAGFVERPQRFLNAHWLNPAYLVPLVEVSAGKDTDDTVTDSMVALLESVGKVPVHCAASPGFIVPRIQALAMNEAARMVEEGVASAEDIDKAVRYGFGFRYAAMGLLEFVDWGGGDILYYASRYLARELESDRFAPPEIVTRNMETGATGLATGHGFYDFTAIDISGYRRATLARLIAQARHLGVLRGPGGSGTGMDGE